MQSSRGNKLLSLQGGSKCYIYEVIYSFDLGCALVKLVAAEGLQEGSSQEAVHCMNILANSVNWKDVVNPTINHP